MSFSKTVMISGTMLSIAIGLPSMAADRSLSVPSSRTDNTASDPSVRIFISGHSLTDRPFPDYIADIARANGITMQWGMHHLPGSSILQRLRDKETVFAAAAPEDESRSALPKDEKPTPASANDRYDLMIITEQHRVLDSLIWQSTVQSMRDYHDRFIAANATGTTYFFSPWISLSDRTKPAEWIEYEREALATWQCTVSQINQDLAAEGRGDRIQFIPASWALARLVEHLTASADVEGFEGLDTSAKIDALFEDDVHLARLGSYYVAAISYSTIYSGDLPTSSPPSLDAGQAEAVRRFATTFMKEYAATPHPSDEVCSAGISLAFASRYTGYTERTYHRLEEGVWAARVKRIRDTIRLAWRFKDGLK